MALLNGDVLAVWLQGDILLLLVSADFLDLVWRFRDKNLKICLLRICN